MIFLWNIKKKNSYNNRIGNGKRRGKVEVSIHDLNVNSDAPAFQGHKCS